MENYIIPTVGILIMKNEKVLLVRHGESAEHLNGKYGLPAGRIQDNESAKEAAQRELKEETGLVADFDGLILLPGEWLAAIERKDGAKQFALTVFLADKFKGQISGNAETMPEWINIDSLDKYDLLPNVENIIKEGLKTR